MDLNGIQECLKRARLDAWLFYDHHHRDPIAYRILKIALPMCTRRWYYLVPAEGEPQKLVHRIEQTVLSTLPGKEHVYASWLEHTAKLETILNVLRSPTDKKRVAMQYSPLNAIPAVGLVDAGTVELVQKCGAEVFSSAGLVQEFEARWSSQALDSHFEAGKAIHALVHESFRIIEGAVRAGRPIDEYGLQQEILRLFEHHGIESDEPPIVAVNAHSGDPHYIPGPASSLPIREGDFVLLDVWAKRRAPGAVYFDITWTGFVGGEVPRRYADIFQVVRQARDAAIERVQTTLAAGVPVHGYEVDDAARQVITSHGYGSHFIHRTGHSIGQEVHGTGANMDNFETHDDRLLIPGTCFSVEPGIYLSDFGVRSEVDVYVEERGARVTGEIQQAVVPILAGA